MKILSQFLISRLKMEYKIKEIEHIDILLFYFIPIINITSMFYLFTWVLKQDSTAAGVSSIKLKHKICQIKNIIKAFQIKNVLYHTLKKQNIDIRLLPYITISQFQQERKPLKGPQIQDKQILALDTAVRAVPA